MLFNTFKTKHAEFLAEYVCPFLMKNYCGATFFPTKLLTARRETRLSLCSQFTRLSLCPQYLYTIHIQIQISWLNQSMDATRPCTEM